MLKLRVKKWNPDNHCYDPHPYPDDWKVSFFCADMDEIVNCACCGKELPYGDTYTSRELYDGSGMFGMAVCPECHEAEWEREKERRNRK